MFGTLTEPKRDALVRLVCTRVEAKVTTRAVCPNATILS